MDRIRIIIVEDEIVIATDIKAHLVSRGFEVLSIATNSEEAMRDVETLKPDVVLLDILLRGGVDGTVVAQKINSRFGIPVVYLTAHTDKATLAKAEMTDFYGYLVKPVNENILYVTLKMAYHKHQLETRIRENEQRLKNILDSLRDLIYVIDSRYRILWINHNVIAAFGDVTGIRCHEVFEKRGDVCPDCPVNTTFRDGQAHYIEKSLRLGSEDRLFVHTSHPFESGEGEKKQALLILSDITRERREMEELNRSREELRNLSAYLESVRERERTAIAREIHDYMGQSLTALKIDLSWVYKNLAGDVAALGNKLSGMMDLVDEAIQNTRNLCSELRPGILDDLGLSAALEWQTAEYEKMTGIQCSFESRPPDLVVNRTSPPPPSGYSRRPCATSSTTPVRTGLRSVWTSGTGNSGSPWRTTVGA